MNLYIKLAGALLAALLFVFTVARCGDDGRIGAEGASDRYDTGQRFADSKLDALLPELSHQEERWGEFVTAPSEDDSDATSQVSPILDADGSLVGYSTEGGTIRIGPNITVEEHLEARRESSGEVVRIGPNITVEEFSEARRESSGEVVRIGPNITVEEFSEARRESSGEVVRIGPNITVEEYYEARRESSGEVVRVGPNITVEEYFNGSRSE